MQRQARIIRCYTEQALHPHSDIELDKRSSHHLSTVLRARVGTNIELFNGDGKNYQASITYSGKKTRVHVTDATDRQTESSLTLALVQAVARGDKMDGIVRQATELGVAKIQPIYTRHSIALLEDRRAERKHAHWRSIIISACEQSGRSRLPELHPLLTLGDYLHTCTAPVATEQRWILSPTAISNPAVNPSLNSATIMIGPESGFDSDELATAQTVGFSGLQLGPRVMRTETAGPAAIAILQAQFGDMN